MTCPHCNKRPLGTKAEIKKHPRKKGRVTVTIYICQWCGFYGSQTEDSENPRPSEKGKTKD